MSHSDATLVCVRNDVTARSPALYNQTTRMVHHKVMSVLVYLHLQGLVFLQEIALEKVLNYCQHFVESVSDRIWTQQRCFSAAMPLLPASPIRHFASPYWSLSLSLQQTRVWKSYKQHQKSCFVFFCFVVFLSLFFAPQSDHHVLRQIKGGPSGQETIKVTCCERMQSDMWRYFYWHLFGCCSVGKKSTFQSWFYRVE